MKLTLVPARLGRKPLFDSHGWPVINWRVGHNRLWVVPFHSDEPVDPQDLWAHLRDDCGNLVAELPITTHRSRLAVNVTALAPRITRERMHLFELEVFYLNRSVLHTFFRRKSSGKLSESPRPHVCDESYRTDELSLDLHHHQQAFALCAVDLDLPETWFVDVKDTQFVDVKDTQFVDANTAFLTQCNEVVS